MNEKQLRHLADLEDRHPLHGDLICQVKAKCFKPEDLGQEDVSECLPGWIASFDRWYEDGKEHTISHPAVTNLLHTLIAAHVRTERLIRERDEARNVARRTSNLVTTKTLEKNMNQFP